MFQPCLPLYQPSEQWAVIFLWPAAPPRAPVLWGLLQAQEISFVFLLSVVVAEDTIPDQGHAEFCVKLGCCAERNTRFVGAARQTTRREPKVHAEDLLPG